MKKFKASLFLLTLSTLFSIGVMAQGPPSPPSDPNAGGNQSPAGSSNAPIDGGASILLILAAGYGLKKLKRVRTDQLMS